MDIATARTRLEEIEAKIAKGVKLVQTGARSIQYDLTALEAERARIQGIIAASSASSFRRVVFKNA